MAYLYIVDVADFLFLIRQTGMTWGNLSAHLSKLEAAGYVVIEKEFLGKRPHTTVRLTAQGWNAFEEYRGNMKRILDNLPAK
jgi:DNA-binding MarR family transcriptional regulator